MNTDKTTEFNHNEFPDKYFHQEKSMLLENKLFIYFINVMFI